MVTGQPRVIHANVANTGLLTDLPAGLGVEVPVAVDGTGALPSHVGALPPVGAALNRSFLGVVDLTVQAAVRDDPRMVRQAAMVDPNAAATLTVEAIWDLCDAMVEAHGDLLPPALRGAAQPDAMNRRVAAALAVAAMLAGCTAAVGDQGEVAETVPLSAPSGSAPSADRAGPQAPLLSARGRPAGRAQRPRLVAAAMGASRRRLRVLLRGRLPWRRGAGP